MYWFLSDTHFGHYKAIQYSNRPFATLKEMDETLIKNINNRVSEEDTIFFLGDFCMKHSSEASDAPINAFDYYRNQIKCKNIILCRGNHDCFSMDTKILTENGYKSYNEIKIGEKIPTVNLNKGNIEYNPILKISCFNVPRAYTVKNKGLDGIYSDKHSHFIIPNNSNTDAENKWDWMKINSKTLWQKWGGSIPTTFPSNNCIYPISEDILSLFTWIHTDGHIGYYKNKILSFTLYQSKENNIKEIESLLKKLNINYRHIIRNRKITHICGKKLKSIKPQHEFHIRSTEARKIQETLMLDMDKFPVWINKLSDSQIKFVIKELTKGDGSYASSGSIQLWGRRNILERWMGILVTHNHSCRLVEDKRGHFYLCIHMRKWTGFSTSRFLKKETDIVDYNQDMWDVEVKNHIIFISRNGKPSITGNSNNGTKTIIENMTINHGGHRIYLTHNPKYYRSDIEWNFSGHCHGNNGTFNRIGKSIIVDLSVDCWEFRPVDINQIMGAYHTWLRGGKTNEATH